MDKINKILQKDKSKPGMIVHTYNPGSQKDEAGGSQVQGSLGCTVRPYDTHQS